MFANPTVQDFIDRQIGGPTPISRAPPPTPAYRGALAHALLGDVTMPRIGGGFSPPAIQAPRRGLTQPLETTGVGRGGVPQVLGQADARFGGGNTGASGITSGLQNLGTGIENALGAVAANRAQQQAYADALAAAPSRPAPFGAPPRPAPFGGLPSFAQRPGGISSGTPSSAATGEGVGGSRSWRNNNPGNIEYGNFAQAHGAVGSDGRFAIFPNEQVGTDAQRALLFNSDGYRNLTLPQAIAKWAPGSENNVPAYVNAMGGDMSGRKMSDYSPAEQDSLLRRRSLWRDGSERTSRHTAAQRRRKGIHGAGYGRRTRCAPRSGYRPVCQQININHDPAAAGVKQALFTSDPTVPGVEPAHINCDPSTAGVFQVNPNNDPATPSLLYFTLV